MRVEDIVALGAAHLPLRKGVRHCTLENIVDAILSGQHWCAAKLREMAFREDVENGL